MDIILLNGPSSSGKSSIARCLKRRIDVIRKSKIIALDDYLSMTTDEPIWEDDVFELTPQMCRDITVDSSSKNPEQIAKEIYGKLL